MEQQDNKPLILPPRFLKALRASRRAHLPPGCVRVWVEGFGVDGAVDYTRVDTRDAVGREFIGDGVLDLIDRIARTSNDLEHDRLTALRAEVDKALGALQPKQVDSADEAE